MECPILIISHFFQSKWNKIIQNTQFWLSCTFSHFPYKIVQNTQFCTFPTKVVLNDSEQLVVLHFFQSFSIKVIQNDSECRILIILHFFQSIPTKVAQNDSEHLILLISHFFPSFPTKVVQNDSECPILILLHFSILSLPKWSEMIQNTQFWSFCTFSNIFHQSGPK